MISLKTNIFVPEKIKVGFQNREGTYTKKLAYVIYYDQKGKLRKEASWNSWRDKKIEDLDFPNEPMSGFVLNKKAGGYSTGWNHRQTYVRVYDPRDFEFEITIANLLYILENTNSIKGKGLEGDFIYGWDGSDLLLIPTSSPDYAEISNINKLRHNKPKFNGKDLIIGATYKSNDNLNLIYLGRFYEANGENKESKAYFFYSMSDKYYKIKLYKSLTDNILEIVDDKCVDNYSNLMDELTKSSYYSERDPSKDEYVNYTLDEFKNGFSTTYYGDPFYTDEGEKLFVSKYRYNWYSSNNYNDRYDVYDSYRNRKNEQILSEATLETIFTKFKPKYLVTYKSNGEVIKKWRVNRGKQ
ncbi:hypothetical protein P4H70_12135 [Paenibacillus ehimensis]|uniref:hypothetical protein n=1 Tax=Paenibacillus ehimensis TaxID=79264 RepID=UPI002DB7DD53|nr:hypothetical protein [Paenibacillus ehimensis]MEC0209680.1 hypothetical protein [Paenibacillus ehimensis]